MAERQRELDLDRAHVQRLIDEAQLPCRAAGTLKSLLRAVAFVGPRHRVKIDVLADRIGMNRATISRTIAKAEALGILAVKRVATTGGQQPSMYAIVETRLAEFCPGQPTRGPKVAAPQDASAPPHDAMAPSQDASAPPQVAMAPSQLAVACKEVTTKEPHLEPQKEPRAQPPTSPHRANAHRRPHVTVDDVEIPREIDTPELREALSDWLEYHADRCRQTYKSGKPIACILRRIVADHGPRAASQVAIEKIAIAIGANYQGFYFGKKSGGKSDDHGRWGPGQVYRAGQSLGDV